MRIVAAGILLAGADVLFSSRLLQKCFPAVNNSQVNQLLQHHGLSNHTYVANGGYTIAASIGDAFINPTILLSPTFYRLEKGARNFILLHEISHLKFHHLAMDNVVAVVALYVLDFFSRATISNAIGTLKILWAALGALNENQADQYAIKHVSNEDLKAALRFLEARKRIEEAQWEQTTDLPSQLVSWYKNLEYYYLQGHPSNEARLQSLINALQSRGDFYSLSADDEPSIKNTMKILLEKSPIASIKT